MEVGSLRPRANRAKVRTGEAAAATRPDGTGAGVAAVAVPVAQAATSTTTASIAATVADGRPSRDRPVNLGLLPTSWFFISAE